MSHPLTVNDVIQAAVYTRQGEQTGVNVFHYRVTSVVGNSVTDDSFAFSYSNTMAPLYKANMPASARFEGVRVQIIHPVTRPHVIRKNEAGPGLGVGDVIPSQVAMIGWCQTGLASRSARGRCYIPFWTEADNDVTGFPTANALTRGVALVVKAYGIHNAAEGADTASAAGGVWSRTLQSFFFATLSGVRSRWGTQRRRSHINRGDPPLS